MTEFYKLFFDVSLYYLLSGYFTILIFGDSPSIIGLILLIVSVFADSILNSKIHDKKKLRIILLCLPLFFFLSKPDLCKIIQILPAWFFIGYSLFSENYNSTYDEFRSEFSFGLKLLFLLILGPLFQERLSSAFIYIIPYLIIVLALGVCMLRVLREKKPDSLRQGIYMLTFVLICIGLTLGNIPQLLLTGFGYVYQAIIAPLIFGIAILFGAAFYFVYIIMKWLVEMAQGNAEELSVELESAAETLGIEEQIKTYNINLHWLKIILLVLLAVAIAYIVFLIFKRFLGSKNKSISKLPYTDTLEKIANPAGKKINVGIIRPRDPRLLVRYYYAKFLAECTKREISIPKGRTVEELKNIFSLHFSKEQVDNLSAVYSVARYSNIEPIESDSVATASKAWKELKHTKKPKL